MSEKSKIWIKAAGIRALKTFAQTFASMITVGAAFREVDWTYVASVACTAGILSIMTSLAGLPEVKLSENMIEQKEAGE